MLRAHGTMHGISVGLAAALTGCAGLRSASLHDLPEPFGQRVHLIETGARIVPIARPCVTPDSEKVSAASFDFIPSDAGGDILIDASVRGPVVRRPGSVTFVLDTGTEHDVDMDSRTARRLGSVTIRGATPDELTSADGHSSVLRAVLLHIDVPPLRAGPIIAVVDTDATGYHALLGHGFVELTGGIIIDRRAGTCTILAPRTAGSAYEAPDGWTDVPWTHLVTEEWQERYREITGATPRQFRVMPVTIGETVYSAVLNTGSGSGVYPFVNLDDVLDVPSPASSVAEHAPRPRDAAGARLSVPLRVGPLRLDGVLVHRPAKNNARRDAHENEFRPDLSIGLATLGDVPVWLDPANNVVRLWTRPGPAVLPALLYGERNR